MLCFLVLWYIKVGFMTATRRGAAGSCGSRRNCPPLIACFKHCFWRRAVAARAATVRSAPPSLLIFPFHPFSNIQYLSIYFAQNTITMFFAVLYFTRVFITIRIKKYSEAM
jgi:hypothetical protein